MYINKSGFEFDAKPGVFKKQKHFMRSIIRVKLLLDGILNLSLIKLIILSFLFLINWMFYMYMYDLLLCRIKFASSAVSSESFIVQEWRSV